MTSRSARFAVALLFALPLPALAQDGGFIDAGFTVHALRPLGFTHVGGLNNRGELVGAKLLQGVPPFTTEFYKLSQETDGGFTSTLLFTDEGGLGKIVMNDVRDIVTTGGACSMRRWTNSGKSGFLSCLEPLPGSSDADLGGMNNAGLIVGTSYNGWIGIQRIEERATFWRKNSGAAVLPRVPPLINQPCYRCVLHDVNASAVIVGWSGGSFALDDRALLWSGSGIHLPTIDSFSEANAVNKSGVVTGYAYSSLGGGHHQAVSWTNGVLQQIGPNVESEGTDINDQGQIVGTYRSGIYTRPFLYLPAPAYGLPAGFYDLWDLTGLWGFGGKPVINNYGVIAYGDNGLGPQDQFLITPPGYVVPTNFPHDFLSADDEIAPAETEDPVSTLSGELLYHPPPDLELGGPFPLRFQRRYASGLDRLSEPSGLGNNWRHNLAWRVSRAGPSVVVFRGSGGTVRFTEAAGVFTQVGELSRPWTLVTAGTGLALLDPATQTIYRFNATGLLTEIADHHGRTQAFSYDAAGQLTGVSAGASRTLSFTYDVDGMLTRVSDGARNVTFTYADGLLESSTDVLGNTTRYEYETASGVPGRMTRWILPSGTAPATQVYDAAGRVTSQTDPLGNVLGLDWSVPGQTTLTYPGGAVQTHRHNSGGELTRSTDGAGNAINLSSDATGRRSKIEAPGGAAVQVAYHPETGRIAKITYPNGGERVNTYAARVKDGFTHHDLSSTTAPNGWRRGYTHDASGRITAVSEGPDATATFTWDSLGRLETSTAPGGLVARYSYNADDTRAWMELDGARTTYEYDTLGRRTAVVRPDGARKTFTYDLAGNVSSVTDELGAITAFEYDADGLLRRLGDPAGALSVIDYDALGRIKSLRMPEGGLTTFEYDAAGRLTATTDATGSRTQLGLDARGLTTEVVDAAANHWRREYDVNGLVTAAITPLGARTEAGWDSMSNLVSLKLPGGATLSIVRDVMGRVTAYTDPLGRETKYELDGRGLKTKVTLANGSVASYQRDVRGYISQFTDPNGAAWTYARDKKGLVTSATDPLGRTGQATYDSQGRLSTVTFPQSLGSATQSYDARGQVTRRAYSDGTVLDFAYDARGRIATASGLSNVWSGDGKLENSNGLTVDRDAAGRVTRLTFAAGKTVDYTYDAAGRLSAVTDWLGGTSRFTYDADWRLVGVSRPNGVTSTLGYDAERHVTSIEEAGAFGSSKITLSRDAAGQTTSATREVPLPARLTSKALVLPGARTYDAAGQLTAVERDGASVAFSYDALGRLLDDGTRGYRWDLASRLSGYTEGEQTVAFTYDALGLVLGRTGPEGTRGYVWNHALDRAAISVELDGASDAVYYVHADNGELLYAIDAVSGARHFFHFDEMGNTVFLTDDAGQVTDAYAYAPYGLLLASTGNTHNPFTWGGRHGVIREGSGGLYRMGQRLYDATTQRFISRDPLTQIHPRLSNPYAYAACNPLLNIDPDGAAPEQASSGFNPKAATNALGQYGDVKDEIELKMQTVAVVSYMAGEAQKELQGLGMKAPMNALQQFGDKMGKASDAFGDLTGIGHDFEEAKIESGKLKGTKYGEVDALAVAELGLKGYQAIQAGAQVKKEFLDKRSEVEGYYFNRKRQLDEALALKLITPAQYRAQLADIEAQYQEGLALAEETLFTDTLFEMAKFAQDALTDLLPPFAQVLVKGALPGVPE